MGKNKKGILDELVDSICSDIEMKGAIEASRDENGKIDITKATAISMGLGHTSNDDISMMAGLLGASGAFDDDTDSITDGFDDITFPIKNSGHSYDASNYMGENAKTMFETLKNYAGTTDLCSVLNQVNRKIKELLDNADKRCNINEPTYFYGLVDGLLGGLIYNTVKKCDVKINSKAPLYDLALSWTATKSEYTGKMLFTEYHPEMTQTVEQLVNIILTVIVVASYKSDSSDVFEDLYKTIFSMMLLLGEEISEKTSCTDFGKNGVLATIEAVQNAMQKVADERLLGNSDEQEATSIESATNSNINIDSVMEKVDDLVSDNDFISKKVAGKEFEITCDSCNSTVKITVTPELTGKCPICGHENQITFSIK